MAYPGVLRWGAGVGVSAAVGRLGVFVWEAVAVAEREGGNVTESLFDPLRHRVCPACGSDTWKAAGYDELNEARDRHFKKNREQAIEILRLQLRVAELEERERGRQRKQQRQARAIRLLEEKLRAVGEQPYNGIESAASPVPQNVSPKEPDDNLGPSPRGMRRLKRNREEAQGA